MPTPNWLEPSEQRIGTGCMRLGTSAHDDAAYAAVGAAVDAGMTIFDTARTYDGPGNVIGGNEQMLARLLRRRGAGGAARVVTKGGMRREGSAWIPDGRARTILSDCEASLRALDGIPIDLYLLHAPDPSRPLRTSLRALARLVDEGLVQRVGLANVNRDQLEEAAATIPVTAVEVALSPFDDSRMRDGMVSWCAEKRITVIAHSPLGGPRRYRALARNDTLRQIATRVDATVEEVALAWVLGLGSHVVAIPGARRPATVRSAARALLLRFDAEDREALRAAFGEPRALHVQPRRSRAGGDVVLVMGIPGAGKSRIAEGCVDQGYTRLNRDVRGGSIRDLCAALDDVLANGTRRVVLDNTWLTRAARSRAVDVARRRGIGIRCVWLEIGLADAQRNVVERILARRESLPTPEEVRQFNGRDGILSPTAQMRALRELEPPQSDEGFTNVERRPFVRVSASRRGARGVFIAAAAVQRPDLERTLAAHGPAAPHLVFDWRPDGDMTALTQAVDRVRALTSATVSGSLCPHPAGPPVCWCRPGLLGLVLQFTRGHGIEAERSLLIGSSATHRSMAQILGCDYTAVAAS